jgi:hypothetical protein
MSEQQVTSFDKLKEKAQGMIIELPGWDDEPFVCRVKRVSLLGLASQGKIPNALLGAADRLFNKPNPEVDIKQQADIFNLFAKETLLEPTLDELNDIGLELTDMQKLILFNFTQEGLKVLERFRTK